MNWNKFFIGTIDEGDHGDENETDSEDEEITHSGATVTTDKNPCYLGIGVHKSPCDYLSQRCIKFVFIMLNSALFLAGIGASVIAIWILTDHVIMTRLLRARFFTMLLLFLSLILAIVSLLGLLGLLQNRKKFLKIYIVCHVLSLFTLYICAIFSFWMFEENMKVIQDGMTGSIANYETQPLTKESWDHTQQYLKCCGVYSAKDWTKTIPNSCCTKPIEECATMSEDISYKSGCLASAMNFLASYMHAITITALILFLFLLVDLFLALCILARMLAECPCPD